MNQILRVNSKHEIVINRTDDLILIKGKNIKTINDFFDEVYKKLNFPNEAHYSFDAYIDWMTDITFFKGNSIILVIDNFDKFLDTDEKAKKKIVDIFKEDILPYWDSDVEKICIGGEKKSFNVYLLNSDF